MKIYVASSWKNKHYPQVVLALREHEHEVYDFRDAEGFSWRDLDPNWESWSVKQYTQALKTPEAVRGFERDMAALGDCDALVYVTPCGISASLELGWAVGAGKHTFAYIPEINTPDLMLKMADVITDSLRYVIERLDRIERLLVPT